MKTALLAGLATAMMATAIPVAAAPPPPHAVEFADVKAAGDKVWDRMDANHDGKIDGADRDARLIERFDRWDTNHDGMISRQEFLAFVHARKDHHHQPGAPDADGPPPPPPPGHGAGWGHDGPGAHPGGMVAMVMIRGALHTARIDGVVTRAAFDAALKAQFDRIDANHDGAVSRDEMRVAAPRGPHGGMPPPPPPPPPSEQ